MPNTGIVGVHTTNLIGLWVCEPTSRLANYRFDPIRSETQQALSDDSEIINYKGIVAGMELRHDVD